MAIRIDLRSIHTRLFLLLLVELLAPAAAKSQEPVVPLQLNFSDPGARSLGLGGAFVALADDATAALANPAGLVQLARPEVSVEGRHWSYSTPFTERGRVEGLPSGRGLDTTVGLETARSESDLTGLSFLSVAYPKGRWSIAFFRHLLANFEFLGETRGLFGGGSDCCQERFYDQRGKTALDLVSYGVSGGFRIRDRLALGLGVILHDVSMEADATMFLPDDDLPGGFFGPTSFLPHRALVQERNYVEDTDWTIAAGLLWSVSRNWTVGGVYRQGAEIELAAERTAGEAGDFGVPAGGLLFRVSGVDLELPGIIGLGFAYRAPNDRVTVSFQWDRVDYSSIVESPGIDDRAIDDVQELHLGAEYAFLESRPIVAVRVGVWLDPDHQIRATTDDPFLRALLPRGDDEIHYAAGLGLAFESFQFDLGVELADRADTVSLSAVYSF